MKPSVASVQKVAQLREFAGKQVPDARLRAALVRAAGDVNAAASVLLTDGALAMADSPILVTAPSQTPACAPSHRLVEQVQRKPLPSTEQRLSTSQLRRLAWRRFYQERYSAAVASVGNQKDDIDAYITGLWKSVGSAKRHEYTSAIRAQLEGVATGNPAEQPLDSTRLQTRNAASSTGLKKGEVAKELSPVNLPDETPASRVIAPAEVANASVKRMALDNVAGQLEAESSPPAKRMRSNSAVDDCNGIHADAMEVVRTQKAEAELPEWPKKIASRLCLGAMLVTGKKKLLVDDEVTLEVPPLPRPGKGLGRAKGKLSGPPRIVRFSKKGREVGRLAPDIAVALAPALQSGFVVATCKVIEAPRVAKMFAEVFLDVSIFLTKEAFEGKAEQEAAECGVVVSDMNNDDDNLAAENGVDARRVTVVNLISSLHLCMPTEKVVDDFPLVGVKPGNDAGAVTEENAEAYYRTVAEIDKGDANSFVPPKHLACTLREYQRAGVGWMVAREKFGSLGHGQDPSAVDAMLNPLWKRREFPNGGGTFFMNATTGGLSLDAPIANAGGTFGGILADEMGLGKTVQCIACIVYDMEQQGVHRNNTSNESVRERSKSPESIGKEHQVTNDKDSNNHRNTTDAERVSIEEDEITPLPPKSKRAHRTEESKPSDDNTQIGKGSRDQRPRRSRRITRSKESVYKDSDEDNLSSESDDKDWTAVKDSKREKASTIEAAESDDDWFESPRKWNRRREKRKQKTESAFEKLMATAHAGKEGFGGTLIICPTSLVTQWMNELHDHVAPNFLRAVTHYGQSRGSSHFISLRCADVVVTTYGILASECPDDTKGDDNDQNRSSTGGGPIFHLTWRRVILDEAHMIKSRITKWARAAFRIRAEKRWCVTGTVIHNHVNDVFSLLRFLQVKPWSSWAFWNRGIVSNIEAKDQASQKMAMSLLRDIISSMTLRRKKCTKDTLGRPIVHLTKKTVEIVTLTPSAEEQDFYSALHERSKVQFDTFVRQGKVMNNFASVLELLLRLRQACDHPYLVFAAAPSKDSIVMKDKDKLFKQFLNAGSSSQYVEKILNAAESGDLQKSVECPLCLDVIDDAVAPKECGHPACRSCLMESLLRSKKCPVCRIVIGPESIATLPRATRFSVDLKKKWRSSAKIDALLKDVKEVHSRRMQNGGQAVGKTVVFSQFTSMLDLVGMALDREKFKSLRIDGSVPQAQRATILERFAKDNELSPGTANVLLVSLRAGGVGLNLVAAAHAILLDIHWNPQVDAQAQDRVHRHGQTRDVVIKRYIVKDSVEERLLQVQDRKQNIADGALGVATDEDKKQARISELKLLFAAQ